MMLTNSRFTRPRPRSNVRRLSRTRWTPSVLRSRLLVRDVLSARPRRPTPLLVRRRPQRQRRPKLFHEHNVGGTEKLHMHHAVLGLKSYATPATETIYRGIALATHSCTVSAAVMGTLAVTLEAMRT